VNEERHTRRSILRLAGVALTDRVYRNTPYNKRPSRTTRNPSDSIFVNGGRSSMLSLRRRSAGGYVGKITMGVHRA
jgi:hypothetical protein